MSAIRRLPFWKGANVEYEKEREEVAYFMRRLYERRLTTCSGGNISLLVAGDTMLITPSGLDKGRIEAEQIAIISLSGKNLTPSLKPSIETEMHIRVYQSRPDVKAVVHAHPVVCSSFSASEKEINTSLIAESRSVLGKPVRAPYARMGSPELAAIVARAAAEANTVLLTNHGVLSVGQTLLQAFDRIEVLEAAATITLITHLLGGKRELTHAQLSEFEPPQERGLEFNEELVQLITQAVLKNLKA